MQNGIDWFVSGCQALASSGRVQRHLSLGNGTTAPGEERRRQATRRALSFAPGTHPVAILRASVVSCVVLACARQTHQDRAAPGAPMRDVAMKKCSKPSQRTK